MAESGEWLDQAGFNLLGEALGEPQDPSKYVNPTQAAVFYSVATHDMPELERMGDLRSKDWMIANSYSREGYRNTMPITFAAGAAGWLEGYRYLADAGAGFGAGIGNDDPVEQAVLYGNPDIIGPALDVNRERGMGFFDESGRANVTFAQFMVDLIAAAVEGQGDRFSEADRLESFGPLIDALAERFSDPSSWEHVPSKFDLRYGLFNNTGLAERIYQETQDPEFAAKLFEKVAELEFTDQLDISDAVLLGAVPHLGRKYKLLGVPEAVETIKPGRDQANEGDAAEIITSEAGVIEIHELGGSPERPDQTTREIKNSWYLSGSAEEVVARSILAVRSARDNFRKKYELLEGFLAGRGEDMGRQVAGIRDSVVIPFGMNIWTRSLENLFVAGLAQEHENFEDVRDDVAVLIEESAGLAEAVLEVVAEKGHEREVKHRSVDAVEALSVSGAVRAHLDAS